MNIEVTAPAAWATAVADRVTAVLKSQPSACIGWPTGATTLPLYAELARRAASGALHAPASRAVMLDDYLDPPGDRFSSWTWLWQHLWTPLGIDRNHVLRIPYRSLGLAAACAAFEGELAAAGGCDLQLLGIGANGHIAFNEPGAAQDSRTRAVTLTPETAAANAAYWQGAFAPVRAVTQGVATILKARQIFLLARGAAKAPILRRMLTDPVGAQLPATFLRAHPGVRILADAAAAADLPAAGA